MVGRHDDDKVSGWVSNHWLQERKITFEKFFRSIFFTFEKKLRLSSIFQRKVNNL